MADGEHKWTRLDLNRPSNLSQDDVCFAYYDYVPGGPFAEEGRQTGRGVVVNLKRSPTAIANNENYAYYKRQAISQFGKLLTSQLKMMRLGDVMLSEYGNDIALVPSPPSRKKDDPDYDDRIIQVCEIAANSLGFVVDEIVISKENRQSLSGGGSRNPIILKQNLEMTDRSGKEYKAIIIVDDMITSGCHFVAIRDIIQEHYGDIAIAGFFLSKDSPRPLGLTLRVEPS